MFLLRSVNGWDFKLFPFQDDEALCDEDGGSRFIADVSVGLFECFITLFDCC